MSSPLTRFADAGDKAGAKRKKTDPSAAKKDTRKADRSGIQVQRERFLKASESGDV